MPLIVSQNKQLTPDYLSDTTTKLHQNQWLGSFAILNALVITLINAISTNWPESLIGKAYLLSGFFLHFSVLSLLLSLPLLVLGYWPKIRPHLAPSAIILFTLAQLIIITNIKVFSLYHFHLNGMVINLLLGGALFENLAFSVSMWLSIIGVLATVIAAEWLLLVISRKLSYRCQWRSRHYWGLFLSAYIGLHLLNGCADAFGWQSITAQNRLIPWMPTTTMRSSLAKMGFDVVSTTANKDFSSAKGNLNYPKEPLVCHSQEPYNLLVLVVDSLRADQLTPEIMPNTYALKSQGISFENHYSSSNATRYGLFTLLYGLSASYWKPVLAAERGSVLFDITLDNHYQYFIYGSSTLTFPEFDRTIFVRVRDQLQQGKGKTSAESDQNISERLKADLRNLPDGKPFFGFLFYDAPHGFSLPKHYPHRFEPMLEQVNYLSLNKDTDPTPFFNLYKTTAHFVDNQIKGLMDELSTRKLLDKTIVVITSDHGQEFNETGQNFWGHNSNFSLWQTKVPMLLLWPGRAPMQTDTFSTHEDLVPTLLAEGFGCTTPINSYSNGYSLFDLPTEPRGLLMESWTDRAILYENHLYLINPLGDIDPVDQNYAPMDDLELPPGILADNIEQMSRFLKAK